MKFNINFLEVQHKLVLMINRKALSLLHVLYYSLLEHLKMAGRRTGAVVSVVDYVPRVPRFETWPGRRSFFAFSKSHLPPA